MTKKKIRKKKVKKTKRPFFDFQGNRFTKLARDYHYELLHLTTDLRRINQKLQESVALCNYQISCISKKDCGHLVSRTGFVHFENSLYHIENFTFRVTGYRDKVIQFVNQGLRIGFDEKSMGILSTIISHGIIRDARLDTELKKFDKDKDFKSTLSERILMTHRRYYGKEGGYSNLMIPNIESKDPKVMSKLWKQNIQAKASRANRLVLKVMEMNDRIMEKINNYLKKHPVQ